MSEPSNEAKGNGPSDVGSLLSRSARLGGRWGLLTAVARGVALFFGVSIVVNGLGEWRRPGFGVATWPVDLRWLPHWAAVSVLGLAALAMLAYARRPQAGAARRWVTVTLVGLLTAAATIDSLRFWQLLKGGVIHSSAVVPLSLLIAGALGLVCVAAVIRKSGRPRTWMTLGSCIMLMITTPLAANVLYGRTDYRRPADVIVVLGCMAYADGRASDALADRVLKACELYKEGRAPRLIFTGGPGQGKIHETEAMLELAMSRGVPGSVITLDTRGFNTKASVVNTTAMFRREGYKRVLVVSHFYHLPRIKLTYQRAGIEVFTVPAGTTYPARRVVYDVFRDAAALGWYYVAGIRRSWGRV